MEVINVIEVFEIPNATILVCDLFDDNVITDTLTTDIGIFNKDEFAVEHVTACFGEPKQRIIGIRKKNLPAIHEIRFG